MVENFQVAPEVSLATVNKLQRLKEQREHHRQVDMLALIDAFPENTRRHLLHRLQNIQFTDGCTGGCPWCGLDVIRKISTGFSFESAVNFFEKYSAELPSLISLYWSSDPLDIGGTKKDGSAFDYADLLGEILPYLRSDQQIFTSTSIPLGTEESLEKLIRLLEREWFRTGKIHYVRLSLVDDDYSPEGNQYRYKQVLARLINRWFHQDFLKDCVRIESRGSNKIQKLGKFFHHPDRNPFNVDSFTIACYDGCLMTPSGLYAIAMEAVTKKSKYGYRLTYLDPAASVIEVPQLLISDDFDPSEEELKRGSLLRALPKIVLDRIETATGRIVDIFSPQSSRREALAMIMANSVLYSLTKLPLELRHGYRHQVELLTSILRGRHDKVLENRLSDDDPEAIVLTGAFFRGIESLCYNSPWVK